MTRFHVYRNEAPTEIIDADNSEYQQFPGNPTQWVVFFRDGKEIRRTKLDNAITISDGSDEAMREQEESEAAYRLLENQFLDYKRRCNDLGEQVRELKRSLDDVASRPYLEYWARSYGWVIRRYNSTTSGWDVIKLPEAVKGKEPS